MKKQASRRRCTPFWIALLPVALAVGCRMGPDWEQPVAPAPENFRGNASAGESVANVPWWDLYHDPVLRGLIEEGLENNRGVRESMARIAESRASLGIVKADLYPNVKFIGLGFYQATGQLDSVSSFDNLKLTVAAGYEVDLWGRVARTNEAAIQGLLATEEAFRTVTISLVSEIASAYLLLRDLDARLEITEATVETRRESLALLSSRADGGLIPVVDVSRAEINLAEAESVILRLTRTRDQIENVMSLLVGRPPSEVNRGSTLAEQNFPPAVPAGLPSELLQRRPDILGAERRLHAQTAKIGIAEATRFPSLSLTASTGVKSSRLGEVAATNSFLNLAANIIGPIFNAGKNKARVEVERARTVQLLNQYEQIVLNAFREVEDALVAVETFGLEREVRLRQLESASDALEVAEARYEGGLTSFMEVLDLQRSRFNAELKASEALQLHHTSIVQLYKALGGGWSVEKSD